MGKGDVKIKTKNGFVETISNVLYAPDLKSNLLSAGQLQEKGYVITIQKGVCEIYDPVRGAIEIVQMSSNRLFPLKIESIQPCFKTDMEDPSWLWHFCYGHLKSLVHVEGFYSWISAILSACGIHPQVSTNL